MKSEEDLNIQEVRGKQRTLCINHAEPQEPFSGTNNTRYNSLKEGHGHEKRKPVGAIEGTTQRVWSQSRPCAMDHPNHFSI